MRGGLEREVALGVWVVVRRELREGVSGDVHVSTKVVCVCVALFHVVCERVACGPIAPQGPVP